MTQPIPRIVLATINAKYTHSSLALRYLMANLHEFASRTQLLEFTLQERAIDIAEKIINAQPTVIGLSCYIWNIALTDEVVRIVKSVRPKIVIILGGPEVSFQNDAPPVCDIADYVICGEGEIALPALLKQIETNTASTRIVAATTVALEQVNLPYHLYNTDDIAHRIVYVESSRGCAFGCEFCISSLDSKVRHFEISRVLGALDNLWQQGVRQFKFIDRTIHLSKAELILDFFQQRIEPDLFLHFEIMPDHLSDKLINLLKKFPPGAIQLEAGVQTFNPDIANRIRRKQNMDKTERNIRRLVAETGVHLHSDLVLGLPGESIDSIAAGFDQLMQTGVHEIQMGVLKRLRGAPIARHSESFKMVYNTTAPYDILQNSTIPFEEMQRLKRFSRYFDLVSNNGNFKTTAPLIGHTGSPFSQFLKFSDWLFAQCHRTSGIALDRLAEYLFEYLVHTQNHERSLVANKLQQDFAAAGKRRFPKCVREFATETPTAYCHGGGNALPERQKRHNQGNRQ